MSTEEMILAMSNGNPGAMTVLLESLNKNEKIDPENCFGPWGLIVNLDSMGVYNEEIWMLHNDLCDRDIEKTTAVTRAWQLGILTKSQLETAVKQRGGLSFKEIFSKIREKLPSFAAA